jgi:hypothetical protein
MSAHLYQKAEQMKTLFYKIVIMIYGIEDKKA